MSDNNSAIREMEHDNCFWGYVGALIGGIIATIPWLVLFYLWNIDIPILTILIPVLAVKGYKFFKGTVNKETFKIIAIISVIVFIFVGFFEMPNILAKRDNINNNLNENVREYRLDILENAETLVVFLLIGLGITYAEISINLKNYKNTNGTIKETNTFIRKDNSPIDSDEYSTGIKIFEKGEKIKKFQDIKSVSMWDELAKNTYQNGHVADLCSMNSKNSSVNNSYSKNTAVESKLRESQIKFKKYIVIGILIYFVFSVIAIYITNYENTTISNNDYDYIYNYEDDNDYNDSSNYNEYYFGLRVALEIPEDWKSKNYYYDYIEDGEYYINNAIFVDSNDCNQLIRVQEKNEESTLFECHYNFLKSLGEEYEDGIAYYEIINGNKAYYTAFENITDKNTGEDFNIEIYTMELDNYYVYLVGISKDNDDLESFYESILNSVYEY
jgi:hypothetical protein